MPPSGPRARRILVLRRCCSWTRCGETHASIRLSCTKWGRSSSRWNSRYSGYAWPKRPTRKSSGRSRPASSRAWHSSGPMVALFGSIVQPAGPTEPPWAEPRLGWLVWTMVCEAALSPITVRKDTRLPRPTATREDNIEGRVTPRVGRDGAEAPAVLYQAEGPRLGAESNRCVLGSGQLRWVDLQHVGEGGLQLPE